MSRTVIASALLILIAGMLSLSISARAGHAHPQKVSGKEVIIGKKGQVHFTTKVKAGDVVLKPGMYQIQHVEEGSEHIIVFREVGMQAGYRMGSTRVAKEVARIKCKVEPVRGLTRMDRRRESI